MKKPIFRRFLNDRAGTILVLTGLLLPVFVGALGLGAEVSYWYFAQRKLQNSADVAAYAGAVKLRDDGNYAIISDAAKTAAINSGYRDPIGTVTTNWPPVSGAYTGDLNAVEVILDENVPRLFTAIFFNGTLPLSGRAVAQIQDGEPACILALDDTASGAVKFKGDGSTELIKCNVHSNSLADDSILFTGSAGAEMPCASAVGGVAATAGLVLTECNQAIEYAEPILDPYASLPVPSTTDPCEPQTVFDGPPESSFTISGGHYCGGLTLKRNITLNSGMYVVDGGDLRFESYSVVNGTGVTFYLVNGAKIYMAGTADLHLSAPTTGTYAGVLFFVDRNEPYNTHIINGDSDNTLNGAVYAQSGHVELAGGNDSSGGCVPVVARTVEVTGSTGFFADCTGVSFGGTDDDQLVMLVE